MKAKFWLILGLLVFMIICACKSKKKDSFPLSDLGESQVVLFAPLPPLETIFSILDHFKVRELSATIPDELYKTKQDPGRNYFALGVLTADAIITARGRNKVKILSIVNEMTRITAQLNLETEVSQLSEDVKSLIERERWNELEVSLYMYKKAIVDKLWERENYEHYTLMLLGGWTEAVNRVSWLIKVNYTPEHTRVLKQIGTWDDIHQNLTLIQSPDIINESYYQPLIKLIAGIKSILESNNDGIYTEAQTVEIFKLTDIIKAEFQK